MIIPLFRLERTIDGLAVVSITDLNTPRSLGLYWDGGWWAFFGSAPAIFIHTSGRWLLEDNDGAAAAVVVDLDSAREGYSTVYPLNPVLDSPPEVGFGESVLSSLVFENVAKKLYGDARLGILLRQINILDQGQGAQYITPTLEDISQEELEPMSHVFRSRLQLQQSYEERGG